MSLGSSPDICLVASKVDVLSRSDFRAASIQIQQIKGITVDWFFDEQNQEGFTGLFPKQHSFLGKVVHWGNYFPSLLLVSLNLCAYFFQYKQICRLIKVSVPSPIPFFTITGMSLTSGWIIKPWNAMHHSL